MNFGGGTRSAFVTVEAGNAAPKTFTVIQSFKLGTAAGIETALIPAGNFMMGSPQTEADRNSTETEYPHQVTLTSAFRMSKHEISNARYAAFLNDRKVPGVKQSGWSDYIAASYTANYNGYRELLRATKDTSHDWGLHWDADKEMWTPAPGMDDYPVIYVTWFGADEFARWAGGNLPTEAQWEYSCRGNNGTAPFGVGTGNELYSDMANFNGRYPYELPDGVIQSFEGTEEHANTNLQRTCEIGTFLPNSYGLYDMHGNVAEWCADWFEEYYGSTAGASVTDPTGPETGNLRSIRGGSWDLLSDKCRSAYRTGSNPDVTCLPQIGFRIVLPAGN